MIRPFEMCDPCNPDRTKTLCDGDCSNNIWFVDGKCKLDQLSYEQVYFVLQRNPRAKADLLRATTDPNLIMLANSSKLITDEIEDNQVAYRLVNKNTLPMYTNPGAFSSAFKAK